MHLFPHRSLAEVTQLLGDLRLCHLLSFITSCPDSDYYSDYCRNGDIKKKLTASLVRRTCYYVARIVSWDIATNFFYLYNPSL